MKRKKSDIFKPDKVPASWQGADLLSAVNAIDEKNALVPLRKLDEPKPVELQATMSRSELLLNCQWPFGKKLVKDEPGEAAQYGLGFHKIMADALGPDLIYPTGTGEMYDRARDTYKILDSWLHGDNPFGVKWISMVPTPTWVEASLVWAPAPPFGFANWIDPPDEDHVYTIPAGTPRPYITGTVDLAIATDKWLLVLDHKTGFEVPSPLESDQLKSLMCAFSSYSRSQGKLFDKRRKVVGFVHAPANSRPTIYAEEISRDDLSEHAWKIHTALERVGDGSLRPGPWCQYCPARGVCPTRTSALAELRAPQGLALTAERVGLRHQTLEIYRDLAGQVDQENRAWIKQNGAAIRPDGKLVDFTPRGYSNLSQASIVRALGPIKGGEVIDKLKEDGCIEQGERMELRVINERG